MNNLLQQIIVELKETHPTSQEEEALKTKLIKMWAALKVVDVMKDEYVVDDASLPRGSC